jgi:hypothetical protein
MLYKNGVFLIGFCIFFVFSACDDTPTITDITINDPNPTLSNIPQIELDTVAPLTVKQFEDSIKFSISYIDGNGDLGTTDPDEHTIELIDNRANLLFTYHLSPRTPAGTEIAIQGTLDIILDNTIILNPMNTSETATFSIRIRDRAGNWSNTVTSESITIGN